MHGDREFSKFFVYLNLFVFSMLMLVLGDNLLVTFLGWEGVGTCSYFLISFWFDRRTANAAAGKKAFVTNRVGDWGFMVAMFLTFQRSARSTTPTSSPLGRAAWPRRTATAIALLLFVGAVGKSAQLPLYIWLPDAMAGPTPVSALIHAATMVTAGVYLHGADQPAAVAPADVGAHGDRLVGRRHRAVRRHHRRRPERHQEGARLLHGQPARLHVPGRRRRRPTWPPSST